MGPVGVIVNTRAGLAGRDPSVLESLRDLLPDEHLAATGSLDEVGPALEALRKADIDTLAIVGGDGTVSGTLTALFDVYGDAELPALMFTRGGTINTIPGALGARGRPERQISRLLEHGPASTLERPALEVRAGHAELAETTRHGLVFANGAGTRFLERYYAGRDRGPSRAALTLAEIVGSSVVNGETARDVFQIFEATVHIDGDFFTERRFTAMAGATIRDIGLGFQPFFSAGLRPDRFHLISTSGNARQLGLEVPWEAIGMRRPGTCLQHASPREVEMKFAEPQPYTLDGDLFPAASTLRIAATRPLRFLET